MRSDLRQLSIGEAFDEAFDLYKRNFGLLALTAAVLYVPSRIIFAAAWISLRGDQFTGAAQPTPDDIERIFEVLAVMGLVMMAVYGMIAALSGAITVAASERYLQRPVTSGDAYRAMFRALPRLLGAWLVIGMLITVGAVLLLIALTFMVGVIMAAVGATGMADQWVGVMIGIAYVVLFLILSVAIFVWLGAFVTPVIMLERAGAMAALQRNTELVRGRAMRLTFGIIGLIFVVFGVQLALVGFLELGLQTLVYPWVHASDTVQRINEAVLGGIVSLCVHPLWMTTFTVLYYDQRVRKEGFDLALMLVDLDEKRKAALARAAEFAG